MLTKYAKIEKLDEHGDVRVRYLEPLTIEHLKVVLEDELIDDAENGERLVIDVVELDSDDYEAISRTEGY